MLMADLENTNDSARSADTGSKLATLGQVKNVLDYSKNEITELKGDLVDLWNGKGKFDFSDFERGAYYESNINDTLTMVKSKSTVTFNHKTTITAKDGFLFKSLEKSGDRRIHDTGWKKQIEFNTDIEYYISIRREPYVSSEVANISEFVSALSFQLEFITEIKNSIQKTNNDVRKLEDEINKIKPEKLIANDEYYANGVLVKCYNPYKNGGNLKLKGQLHCHAREKDSGLYYDGTSSAKTTLEMYKTVGYDFMTITDYGYTKDGVTKPNDNDIPDDFIWLYNSQEVSLSDGNGNSSKHICTYNGNDAITDIGGISTQAYVNEYKNNGRMMSLAHPFYHGTPQSISDIDKIKRGLRFVEVYNGLCADYVEKGTWTYYFPDGCTDTDYAWQRLLDNGNITWGIAVSDNHNIINNYMIRKGYVQVFANEKTRYDILKNLSSGNFIASSYLSASIESISFNNGVITVNTGDSNAITKFIKEGGNVVDTVNGLIATYTMDGTEKYVRTVVTNSDGDKIWVQPIVNIKTLDYDSNNDFIE